MRVSGVWVDGDAGASCGGYGFGDCAVGVLDLVSFSLILLCAPRRG